jgi:ATP/maltotriose-dependent transcriptional regulator MalT
VAARRRIVSPAQIAADAIEACRETPYARHVRSVAVPALVGLVWLAIGCTPAAPPLRPQDQWSLQFDAAKAAMTRGDQAAAEHEMRKALAAAGFEDPPGLATAVSLNGLSVLCFRGGRLDEAATLNAAAIRIVEGQQETESDVYSTMLTNRADIALQRGDLSAAERDYRLAAAIGAVPATVHERAVRGLVGTLCLDGRRAEAERAGAPIGVTCPR